MRTVLVKVLLAAALALGLSVLPGVAAAQKALVYCPIALDRTGCDAIVTALTAGSAYPGGVDRGYDGTGGTVDLRSAELVAYTVFVVPSLADDSTSRPYAFLRDSVVVEHLRAALIGGLTVWSGTPDQGSTDRAEKDQLIQNLAQWAGASYAAAHGPGLVALLDLSEDQDERYDWLRAITPTHLTSDLEVVAYDSVRSLTPTATAILAAGNGSLAYASMAALGLATPTATPGLSLDAVGATGTTKGGQVVLATLAAGNTTTAAIATDKRDYAPGTTVTITGTGWAPGETVTTELVEDPLLDTHPTLTAVADQNGNWTNAQFSPDDHDISVRFIVTATGGTSGMRAQTSFTDAADLSGVGTMTVSPTTVTTPSTGNSFTFTFTNSHGSQSFSPNSQVTLTIPSGWPAPSTTSGNPGFVTKTSGSCVPGALSISGNVITVLQACASKTSFTITYANVTPPTTVGTYTFTTRTKDGTSGTLTNITTSPTVLVIGTAADGDGTMTVSPASVIAGQTGRTLTFTFAPPANYDFGDGSTVNIVVPSDWSAPQKSASGSAGFVTISSSGCASLSTGTGNIAIVSGNTIQVTHSCDHGQQFVLTYSNATAPTTEGSYTFTTSTDNSAVSGGAATIAAQPAVAVAKQVGSVSLGAQSPTPITAGASATYAIAVNRGTGTGSFNATLSVATPLPTGATASFSPSTVSFASGDASKTSTLTIGTSTATPGATTSFTVQATNTISATDIATATGTLATTPAADGAGTMTVSPTSVDAGQTGITLTFTFAVPVTYDFADGSKVNITVPAGWPAPQKTSSGSPAYVQVSSSNNTCPSGAPASGGGSITISGNTITVDQSCDNGDQFRLTYANVTAPATVGTSTFTVSADNSVVPGGAVNIDVQPTVTVTKHVGSVSVGPQSPTPVTAGAGATYAITVNRDGGTGSFSASLSATSLPGGTTVSFSPSTVSFASSDASKTSTLTISTSGSTPAGTSPSFTVQATNTIAAGDVATATGTLTVSCQPVITVQPVSQGVNPGQSATFSVSAIGGTPLNYQWRKGGVAIGTNASSYTTSDAGTYDVIVSSTVPGSNNVACGTVTSNTVTLAVNGTGNVGSVIVDAQSPSPVMQGSSATYPVTVSRGAGSTGSFDATMTITASWPTGVSYSFSGLNGQGQLHFGNGANSMTTTLTVTTTGATAAGTYPFMVKAADASNGSNSATGNGTLVVGAPTHTITASAGSNGSISPSGAVTVNDGANQTFMISANTGSRVADVLVDGSSVGAVTTYTFSNVTVNHTIAASFVINFTSSVTVNCPATAQVYTGAAQSPCTASYSTSDGLSGSLTVSYTNNTNVGTAHASASYAGDATHASSSNSATFSISKASSTVTVTCAGIDPPYTGGAQTPCSAAASGAGMSAVDVSASLVYSNNTNVGTATATASWDGDLNHTGNTGSGGFTIGQASSTVTVTCTAGAPYTYTGSPQTPCTATATGAGGLSVVVTPVTYTSNTNVGTAGASATYGGDANHTGSTGTGGFAIGQAASTTAVSCPTVAQTYTGSPIEPCTATATGAGGLNVAVTPVTYTANTNVGTAGASATYAGDANHFGSTGTGSFEIGKAASTTAVTFETGSYTYRGTAFTATAHVTGLGGLDAAITPVSYSGDCVNVTSANGCTATATYGGDGNHEGSSDTKSITITQADATVTVTGYTGTYDGAAHGATGTATGVGGANLNAGLNLGATFTDVPGGTASWTFTGGTNYKDQSGTAAIVITKADATIAVTPYSVIYDGAAHTATGTAKGVLNETLSGLNLSGTTHTYAGTYNGDAWSFTDVTGNYNPASGTVNDAIAKATPSISWANPADIVFGAALGPTQLNATASVAGSISYNPPAGTVLGVGAGQTLSVTFSPNDGSNYNTATGSVRINVIYASSGLCLGSPGHQILQPVNADGSSAFKKGSTVPVKFRVCDANGVSIGTLGVAATFKLVKTISGTITTTVLEDPVSTTPDTDFRWDSTNQQWIFNLSTKNLTGSYTYFYRIALRDGSNIDFDFYSKP